VDGLTDSPHQPALKNVTNHQSPKSVQAHFRAPGAKAMSQNEEVFSAEERHYLAVKAVKRLIADAKAKRLVENRELTEAIAACIQDADLPHLKTLKWLMTEVHEQELEGPDPETEFSWRKPRRMPQRV
jgi:hypothetical protein